LLGDRHGAAPVSRDGSIDWLCLPRFDSSSIFARLLDDAAGHWSIRVPAARDITRRYLDRTMVLEATYRTATGVAVVVDALAMGEGNRGHELGTFLLCTFWLAQALAVTGQPDRARTVFERAVPFVNDAGLLAQEIDPATGELLGNYPQAFSHIGLINAAWAISPGRKWCRAIIRWPGKK
jgi:GH15 family glucan-1,4-alpha-glucosidase